MSRSVRLSNPARGPAASAAAAPLVVLDPIAQGDAPVLHNLFELYAHDFSDYMPLELKPNGRFGAEAHIGHQWWTRVDHFPFFIRANGKLCGFALAAKGSLVRDAGDVMDVAEFFVIRGARRNGVGTRAAHALFTAFPAVWEVRVRAANEPALKFWLRAAEAWSGRAPEREALCREGVDWHVLRAAPPQR